MIVSRLRRELGAEFDRMHAEMQNETCSRTRPYFHNNTAICLSSKKKKEKNEWWPDDGLSSLLSSNTRRRKRVAMFVDGLGKEAVLLMKNVMDVTKKQLSKIGFSSKCLEYDSILHIVWQTVLEDIHLAAKPDFVFDKLDVSCIEFVERIFSLACKVAKAAVESVDSNHSLVGVGSLHRNKKRAISIKMRSAALKELCSHQRKRKRDYSSCVDTGKLYSFLKPVEFLPEGLGCDYSSIFNELLGLLPHDVAKVIEESSGSSEDIAKLLENVKTCLQERVRRSAVHLNMDVETWQVPSHEYIYSAASIALKYLRRPSEIAALMNFSPDRQIIAEIGSPLYNKAIQESLLLKQLDDVMALPKVSCIDISYGRERIPIPAIGTFGVVYPELEYITKSVPHPSSGLHPLIFNETSALGCNGLNCCSSLTHRFAVVERDGSLNDIRYKYDETRGILVNIDEVTNEARGYGIVECNAHCACNPKTCPNRVVQRGRQVKIGLFWRDGVNFTLRALEFIRKGTFVIEYIGEIISNAEAERRGKRQDANHASYLFDIGNNCENEKELCIDASRKGNAARFANHSCDPNLVTVEVYIESGDPRLPHVGFFAKRDIAPLDELTYNYYYNSTAEEPTSELIDLTSDALSRKPVSIACHCGATNCKGVLWN